ncbi:unnamed protein product [Pleuronectes platessa]|uniref:CWH43-like N-terminal domain-containing protein n=1 Tax=Pleuronectes platessa TaxID=8262 RepID=A0A9N7V2U3_PLEPL|nr:unnamed protein product [Pleuronectes platessa]
MATVYVRYKQVEALTGGDKLTLHRLNRLPRDKTTLFSKHLLGALLTFGVGALYILVQTLLSLKMQPHVHSRSIYPIRLSIGPWTLSSIISSIQDDRILNERLF